MPKKTLLISTTLSLITCLIITTLSLLNISLFPPKISIPKAQAATETIGLVRQDCAGYSNCFTSLNAWEAAYGGIDFTGCTVGDLVCVDKIAVAQIDGAWTSPDTTAVTIDGWATDATRYIRIYTTEEARHDGKWNTGKYRLERGVSAAIEIAEDYVIVDGLQILQSSNDASYNRSFVVYNQNVSNEITISHCILKAEASGTANNWDVIRLSDADLIIKFYNNIAYDWINGTNVMNGFRNSGLAEAYLYNNTFVNIYSYGFQGGSGVIAKNNITQDCPDGFNGTFNASSDYNISDIEGDTIDISSYREGLVTDVSFVNESSNDFHLSSSDTSAKDAGTDLSGTFTTDIDGDTRSEIWDIGADENGGTSQTCAEAEGICKTNTCSTYTDCSSVSGTGCSGYCCSGACTTAAPDTEDPTVPTNLTATAVSSSQINLSWTASTDNVGVTGYNIYRNAVLIDTSATNSYPDTGLTSSTLYTYTISAYDAVPNTSGQSGSASATTDAFSGNVFYVLKGATGNGNGTSWIDAWDDLDDITGIQAGDTVYIGKGNSNYIGKYTFTANGTSEQNRIIIRRATISEHGSNTGWNNFYDDIVTIQPTSSGIIFTVTDRQYITIDGADKTKFILSGDGAADYGIYSTIGESVDTEYITISNLTIKNMDNNGINMRDYSSEIIIHDVEIYGCGTAGSGGEYANICCAYTSNSVPANCSVYNSIIHEPGNGVTIVDNFMGMSGFDIYNNIIYQDAMKSASADNLFITGSNIKIYDNLIYSANSDNSNQNIYIFTMSDGSTSPSHIRIYNNIIYKPLGAGGFGIYFRERDDDGGERGVVEDIDVFNNVIYGQEYPFFFREANSEGILDIMIENNIIRSGVTYEIYMDGSGMADDVITNYNYYYQDDCSSDRIMRTEGTYTLSQAQTAGREINGGCGNPQFDGIEINGFHLTESSPYPVKDGGLTDPGSGLFSDDKDGTARPQNTLWDIGAYEYVSSNAHYVDNAASGNNDGTSWQDAWQSFGSINWASIQPGDTIYISGGSVNKTYYETLNIGVNGEEGKRITIQPGIDSGHNGTVIIDCDNTRNRAIDLNGKDYITIDGVRGNAIDGNYDYGFKIVNLALGSGGIYALGGGLVRNILITHIDFDGTGIIGSSSDAQGPIRMGSSTTPIENLEISYCWIHGESEANKWGVSAITIFSESGDPYISRLIHHNRVENIYHDGIKVGGRCSIYNNYIANIEGSGHSDSIMISSSSYVKIYNNFIDDSDDQNIFLDKIDSGTQSYIYIYNNIFDNDNGFGVVLKTEGLSSYFDNIHLYNNTFVSTSGPNLRDSQGRLANVYIKNNIFSAVTGGYQIIDIKDTPPNPIADADAYDYNCYDPDTSNYPLVCVWPRTTGRTFAELQAMSVVRETHGVVETPVYVNPNNDDFDLGDTCPETIRTGGVDLSSVTDHLGNPLFNTDYDGNIRTVWSMGAYEYTTSQTCAEAGGTCQTNTCVSYDNCSSLSGTCATGSCCSGVCSDPPADTTPPSASISINSSELINSQNTSLNISATDPSGVTEMKISNTNNFTIAITEAYTTVKSWVLTAGDELKIVYAWFKDSIGNWTSEANPITDTITLDETSPTISNITASNIITNSATISFNTNELTTSYIEYGLTTSYGSQTETGSQLSTFNFLLSNLSSDTIYNYRITSTDEANNISQSINYTFTTEEASTPDTTPPANITDLTSSDITQTSVSLNWTSPGDDNSVGTASAYDLRYSTTNITNDTEFNSATQLSGEPNPQVAGTSQSLYIAVGLSPNTSYYFAIKTSDEVPNISNISNILSITTLSVSTPPSGGGGTVSDTTPPSQPANFTATPAESQIFLSWNNPTNSDFVRVKILRKENEAPTSHNDQTATIIYEGTAEEYTDIDLDNNKTYHYAIFAYDQKPNYSEVLTISAQPEEGKTNIEIPSTTYPDGTLIKISESFKVYLIINQKKKWIPTPEVFETLGYQWGNIIITTKTKLNRIPNYEDNLIRANNNYKVYLVVNGISRHIPNPEIFLDYGFAWDDVVDVPQETIDQYQRAYLIRESRQERIYYLREDGIKKHIPNPEVFSSYNNKWDDIQVISKPEMESYLESNLIQLQGDNGIYLLENNMKRHISNAEIFNRHKFNWNHVVTVNETEFEWYKAGSGV